MSLSMRAITKSFSSNAVLKGVDFALEDGEIRALIGENGAGKTTLMNILGGVLRPDAGVIELDAENQQYIMSLLDGIASEMGTKDPGYKMMAMNKLIRLFFFTVPILPGHSSHRQFYRSHVLHSYSLRQCPSCILPGHESALSAQRSAGF